MFTRCPSCRAAFSINQQQLEIAAGMVRCGMCEHVFDAKLFLFNQELEEELTQDDYNQQNSQNAKPVDVELSADNNSSIDLEVLDRELHGDAVAELTEVTNIVDEVPETNSFEDTHVSHDIDQPARDDDDQSEEPVIPKIIADQVSNLEKQPSKFHPLQWLGSLTILVLIALVSLQVVAAIKVDLIPNQYQQPVCEWLACTIETPRAVNKIEVLNRSIYTHPSESQALMVTLTIINRAEFSQPYPIIQLHFLNISGDVIAARQFSANHYLREKWVPQKLMNPATPLSIQLEVHDVGEEVVSYNFDFL